MSQRPLGTSDKRKDLAAMFICDQAKTFRPIVLRQKLPNRDAERSVQKKAKVVLLLLDRAILLYLKVRITGKSSHYKTGVTGRKSCSSETKN